MATALKNARSAPSATTLTTIYTVPALTSSVISTIMVCNRSASATSFRIALLPLGAAIANSHYLYYDVTIAGNDTFAATLGITMIATDVLQVYATNATLSFNVFLQETT